MIWYRMDWSTRVLSSKGLIQHVLGKCSVSLTLCPAELQNSSPKYSFSVRFKWLQLRLNNVRPDDFCYRCGGKGRKAKPRVRRWKNNHFVSLTVDWKCPHLKIFACEQFFKWLICSEIFIDFTHLITVSSHPLSSHYSGQLTKSRCKQMFSCILCLNSNPSNTLGPKGPPNSHLCKASVHGMVQF